MKTKIILLLLVSIVATTILFLIPKEARADLAKCNTRLFGQVCGITPGTKPFDCDYNGTSFCCNNSTTECNSSFGHAGTEGKDITSRCQNTNDPEFHSLRPYPASPCQVTTSNYAKFCGNTLTLQDQIDVIYRPGIDNCSQPADGKVVCNYVVPRSETITIDLSNAKLPIMGNTENVPNSQSKTGESPTLSDTDKVNGYVSWYLNGIMNRAEDGSAKASDSATTDYNIVNLSGPLNKLLPQDIQNQKRIKSVTDAGSERHNQIVVCTKDGKPVDCYKGDGSPAEGKIYKLKNWEESRPLTSVYNFLVNAYSHLFPGNIGQIVNESIGNAWKQNLPPLMSDPQFGGNEKLYLKAYNEWRGKSCILVPVVNMLFCIDNPLVPKDFAELFPYVPLSSTEDVKGNIKIDSVSVGGEGITNVTFNSQSSTLYFPHLVESDQLGSTLQDTYISKDQQKDQKTGPDTAVEPPSSCTTVDVRLNAGDNLFATSLSGTLGYTASFSCTFNAQASTSTSYCKRTCTGNRYCKPDADGGTCVTDIPARTPYCSRNCRGNQYCLPDTKGGTCETDINRSTQTCSKTVSVALSTTSNTPKIDNIWSRLVGGPTAVVKRMFPKLGTQIGTLKDMPGSTSITYSGAAASSGELNLPHIGGVSEYFLKGIQTLLRPKGFGDSVSFGVITNNLPSGGVDCDKSAPNISLPNTLSKGALHQLAINWEGQSGDHILECYNDVARKSLAAGISPAFTFLVWINESGGSNYNISNQDWGINSSQVVGLTAQLSRFLQLPSAYKTNYPQCFGKTKTDTEVFFDLFYAGLQGGQCAPGAGQPYIDLVKEMWSAITTCPFTSYPFSSSCY